MNSIFRFVIFIFLCVSGGIATATSVIQTAQHFSDIKKIILSVKDPQHTLLALDDDDTLTMMPCPTPSNCQYLGGPTWFTWQAGLPANHPDRIYRSFSQLLNINNLIFWVSRMPLVESTIPDVLKIANRLKMPIVIASARGFTMIPATEKQLSEDGIFEIIKKRALPTSDHQISFPGYYMTPHTTREIAYQNGILYFAGQNKGIMIQDFLKKTHQTNHIHNIIFVDDTYQNDLDVANAYKHNAHVKVISVYYTYLKAHQKAFLTDKNAKKLQAMANQRWYAIDHVLQKNLPGLSL